MKLKEISLALGGGAARGLIHIGILKYLEEQNIEVKEISGTSMGAIIASLYAIGMNSLEIKEFAKSINFFKLADFDLKTGLLKGKKIENKLKEVLGNKKIENTQIPLKIIATNIETAETKIFTKGLIIDAVRASLSLPGIFKPKVINNQTYIDGGVMMNLPIEVLEGKNIIAVSALKINKGNIIEKKSILGFSFTTGFLKNNFEIIKKSVILMMKANEDRSLETKNKNIILIRPDFGKLDIIDFNKVDEFENIGYNEIKNKLIKI